MTRALDPQQGSGHYKDAPIPPAKFLHKNSIGHVKANAWHGASAVANRPSA